MINLFRPKTSLESLYRDRARVDKITLGDGSFYYIALYRTKEKGVEGDWEWKWNKVMRATNFPDRYPCWEAARDVAVRAFRDHSGGYELKRKTVWP